MPATYDSIASTTLGSAVATVEFSGISGSYTDLIAVINSTLVSSSGAVQGIINSDTGSNYSITRIIGNGSTATSDRVANTTSLFLGDTGTTPTTIIAQFQNYSNTTTHKTIISRSNDTTSRVVATVNLYRASSIGAITTIKFQNNAAVNFAIGSTFTLYGIKAA